MLGVFLHGNPTLEVQESESSLSAVERAMLSGEDSELVGLGFGLGAELPLQTTKRDSSHWRHPYLDFSEEYDQPVREELPGAEIPGNSDDAIKVEFRNSDQPLTPDLLSDSDWLTAVPQPLPQREGNPTAWTISDFYDYLSPDDELSAIETTLDPEPTLTPPADMEDENPSLTGSPVPTFTLGNDNPKPPSQSQTPPLPSPPQGSEGCGLGFVRSEVGGECVSQCDAQPDFCFNRGVCTIATGIGAFCRCNIQDYVWNKGSRCDWMVTDFQVLCVVVGVASLTLILLIVIIVFFAKRLHRLRRENRRLRKHSLYRPHSEMQTDGFSVSTAQGVSNANVRKLCASPLPPPQPHAHNLAYYDNITCQDDPQKKEEPSKSPLTGDESLNITNSYSPKHVNNCPVDSDQIPNNGEEVNREDANSSPSNNLY
ncbi:chondroitin sulfate proteoglycan 5 [Esox lucius]|uniref:chondroitin sulfate proteoglycan 5 n=1 Tax=Esox lucius TaxID=8010 RepID=UPI00057783EC|nr:chondroitin sulfate proteoglycan 5 [Esox lucius]